jgi:hypothetical protein
MADLRDRLVRTAQAIEDQYGALVQLHRIGIDGQREMLTQVPHLGGTVTQTSNVLDVLRQEQSRCLLQEVPGEYEIVCEGSDKFVLAATPEAK